MSLVRYMLLIALVCSVAVFAAAKEGDKNQAVPGDKKVVPVNEKDSIPKKPIEEDKQVIVLNEKDSILKKPIEEDKKVIVLNEKDSIQKKPIEEDKKVIVLNEKDSIQKKPIEEDKKVIVLNEKASLQNNPPEADKKDIAVQEDKKEKGKSKEKQDSKESKQINQKSVKGKDSKESKKKSEKSNEKTPGSKKENSKESKESKQKTGHSDKISGWKDSKHNSKNSNGKSGSKDSDNSKGSSAEKSKGKTNSKDSSKEDSNYSSKSSVESNSEGKSADDSTSSGYSVSGQSFKEILKSEKVIDSSQFKPNSILKNIFGSANVNDLKKVPLVTEKFVPKYDANVAKDDHKPSPPGLILSKVIDSGNKPEQVQVVKNGGVLDNKNKNVDEKIPGNNGSKPAILSPEKPINIPVDNKDNKQSNPPVVNSGSNGTFKFPVKNDTKIFVPVNQDDKDNKWPNLDEFKKTNNGSANVPQSGKENPKIELPKEPEKPKTETHKEPEKPKTETPKVPEKPKTETPKVPEKPKTETPKVPDKPKTETPKEPEKPKTETPKPPEKTKTEVPKELEKAKTEIPKEPENPFKVKEKPQSDTGTSIQQNGTSKMEEQLPRFGPTMKPPYKRSKPCSREPNPCCVDGEITVNLNNIKGMKNKDGNVDGIQVMQIEKGVGQNKKQACSSTALVMVDFDKLDQTGCFGCLEAPFCGKRMLKIVLKLSSAKRGGWLFNVGDSETNNGYRGDDDDQINDSEVQGLYPNVTVYPSDNCLTVSSLMHIIDALSDQVNSLTIRISNEHVRITNSDGLEFKLCHKCLFALNGQPDSGPKGSPNERVCIGLNRVVKDLSRSGYGVCSATFSWECPWCS